MFMVFIYMYDIKLCTDCVTCQRRPPKTAYSSLFVNSVCCNFLCDCFEGIGPGQSGYVQRCGYQLE